MGWASEYFGEGTEGKSVGEAYDGKEFLSDACYKYEGRLYKNKGILLFLKYFFQYLYFLDMII